MLLVNAIDAVRIFAYKQHSKAFVAFDTDLLLQRSVIPQGLLTDVVHSHSPFASLVATFRKCVSTGRLTSCFGKQRAGIWLDFRSLCHPIWLGMQLSAFPSVAGPDTVHDDDP